MFAACWFTGKPGLPCMLPETGPEAVVAGA